MKRILAVVILACFMPGCGDGSGPGSTPNPDAITAGNWSFNTLSSPTDGHLISIGGVLSASGATLSGTMAVDLSVCSFNPQTAVTGTVSESSFTLKSASIDGQVITIQGTMANSKSLVGTYSISGGCADGERGSIVGVYVPPLTGTWRATESVNGSDVVITLNLTQQTAADHGFFHVSGTASYSGSPCALSGTINSNLSFVTGNVVGIFVNTSEVGGGSGQLMYAGGLDDPAIANSFSSLEGVLSGSCTSSTDLLVFTKQP